MHVVPNILSVVISEFFKVTTGSRAGSEGREDFGVGNAACLERNIVGMSDTPEGLQLQIDAAKGFANEWRLSTNAIKCAVVVCNEDCENHVECRWKWGMYARGSTLTNLISWKR